MLVTLFAIQPLNNIRKYTYDAMKSKHILLSVLLKKISRGHVPLCWQLRLSLAYDVD